MLKIKFLPAKANEEIIHIDIIMKKRSKYGQLDSVVFVV